MKLLGVTEEIFCGNCLYYGDDGYCHKNAPRLVSHEYGFPAVDEDSSWCGEWVHLITREKIEVD